MAKPQRTASLNHVAAHRDILAGATQQEKNADALLHAVTALEQDLDAEKAGFLNYKTATDKEIQDLKTRYEVDTKDLKRQLADAQEWIRKARAVVGG